MQIEMLYIPNARSNAFEHTAYSKVHEIMHVLSMCLCSAGEEIEYLEEVPLNLLDRLSEITGHSYDEVIVLVLQYGANFSGPGKDVFRIDRATGEPSDAHNSNFLHPVFYHYKQLPTGQCGVKAMTLL